ncbi:putative membrane protein, partial [Yersinia pestis PY-91]
IIELAHQCGSLLVTLAFYCISFLLHQPFTPLTV